MEQRISRSVEALRSYFKSGATKSVEFRLGQLKKFKDSILKNQEEIIAALWSDLHKSREEAYLTEIAIVLQEIDCHIKHLKSWAKPQKVHSPLFLFPSSSFIVYEPLGVALIVAPWNYPFQLTLNPLVGAISSGCCAMIKPSPYSSATSKVIEKIVEECFESRYIDIVQGNREVNTLLLQHRYDIIFFTGSPALARIVSRSAAENLTPLVLELGGKSPCIVDKDAKLAVAAKRIAWGKLLNAGQTCIAPDYLLVHRSIKKQFIEQLKLKIEELYGSDIKASRFYPRIINDSAFNKLCELMKDEKIIYGGETDPNERYIAPTILDEVTTNSRIMQEEIFGPIIPIIAFDDREDVYQYIADHEKPLALYYFGESGEEVLRNTSSGGGCINDTIMHISNHNLPFGGVGNSGMGIYHGKESFLAYSNRRSIVKTPTWIDLPLKYAPYKFFELIKRIL